MMPFQNALAVGAGFLLALGLALPVVASSRWMPLDDGDGRQGRLYLDQDSVTTEPGGWRRFWIKSLPQKGNRKDRQARFREVRLRHALDCRTREVIPPLEILCSRGKGRSPERIFQDPAKVMMTRRDILTLPAGERIFKAVCGEGPPSQPPSVDASSAP